MDDNLTPAQQKRLHDAIRIVIQHLVEWSPSQDACKAVNAIEMVEVNTHHKARTSGKHSAREE